MSVCRRITSVVMIACFQVASAQAQTPEATLAPTSAVITDSKDNPRAIRVEFQIRTDTVVGQVRLYYRQFGKNKYSDQLLKLNHELFYQTLVPFSEKYEYYLTVKSERGDVFTVGTSAEPRVLQTEGLPRALEIKQSRMKKIAIWSTVTAVAILSIIVGEESLRKKK